MKFQLKNELYLYFISILDTYPNILTQSKGTHNDEAGIQFRTETDPYAAAILIASIVRGT